MKQEEEAVDHIVMFPFMAKGHTIPLLHLAAALSTTVPNLHITFITTPANASFLRRSLPESDRVTILLLPFPSFPPLPTGVESTDSLPSFSLFPAFLAATSLLRHPFDSLLTHLSRRSPLCLISDFFFGWTLDACNRLGIPRVVFHGMSPFSMVMCKSLWLHLPSLDLEQPFHVPGTPTSLLLTKEEIPDSVLRSTDPDDPGTKFLADLGESDVNSWGVLVNSFEDVEGQYTKLFESFYRNGARAWLVGPLCFFSDQYSSIGVSPADDDGVRMLMRDEGVRMRAKELGKKARKAVEDGGSSRRRLSEMLEELRRCRRERKSGSGPSGVESGDGGGEVVSLQEALQFEFCPGQGIQTA